MKNSSHKTWQTSHLVLKPLQMQNLRKKSGGHSILCPPRPKKWGGTFPVSPNKLRPWWSIYGVHLCRSSLSLIGTEMINIWFASWISGRIVSLQPDTDIQNLLWNGNRIGIQISETLLLIFRGFRLLEKVAHCTIIHLLSSFRSIFSAICAVTPSLAMVYSLYNSVISFPS